MAGRGQVSWLPGLARRTFPGNPCPPQWLTQCARDVLDPVTVAGPRRLLTGLPLTTDRYLRGSVSARRQRGGRSGQPGVQPPRVSGGLDSERPRRPASQTPLPLRSR